MSKKTVKVTPVAEVAAPAEVVKKDNSPIMTLRTNAATADAMANGGARAKAINAAILARGPLEFSVKELQAALDAEHGAGAIRAVSGHLLHLKNRRILESVSTGRYRLTQAVQPILIEKGALAAPKADKPKVKRTTKPKAKAKK